VTTSEQSRSQTAQPVYQGLSDVVSEVEALARARESVSVENVVESLGRASMAALVLITALVAATPLSGIPGVSVIAGATIAIISAQAVLGRRRIWLPSFLLRRHVSGSRLLEGLKRVRPVTNFLDRHTHERLEFLVRRSGAKLLFLICTIGGSLMPLLEFIPFSSSGVAICIVLLSLSILTLDGLLALITLSFFVAVGSGIAFLI
jgi:hypothetical protein